MSDWDIATPYTAVYLIVRKADKIAFLLRGNTGWMDGHYGLIAGRVEKNERFLAAAVREAKEEAGIDIKEQNLKQIMVAHRISPDSLWVDMFFEVTAYTGKIHNAEPDKHDELAWFDPNDLPGNVIPAIRFYIEQIEAGKTYVEYGWED